MRILARRQVGATVGGIAAGVAATAAGAPELIPIAAPAGALAGSEAEKAIRGVMRQDGRRPELSEVPLLRDAFLRLEGATRAAERCDIESMVFDLQLAEYVKERPSVERFVNTAAYAKELEMYLERTLELRRNVLPRILRERCGCR